VVVGFIIKQENAVQALLDSPKIIRPEANLAATKLIITITANSKVGATQFTVSKAKLVPTIIATSTKPKVEKVQTKYRERLSYLRCLLEFKKQEFQANFGQNTKTGDFVVVATHNSKHASGAKTNFVKESK